MSMRILALDVGERRVGMAVSDLTGALARPLQALMRRSREEDFAAIAAVVAEHDVGLIVVGQPLSLDGGIGPQARQIARYAEALAERLSVQIVMWDERFTTMEAEEILRQRRSEKKRRQARTSGELDAIAAAVILQSYLDSHYLDDHDHGSEPPPGDI
jgi:putative holliday junction resolvase